MSIAERAKQTLETLRDVFKSPTVPENMTLEEGTRFCDEKYGAIIEQALLAERRLAMEEAAKIVDRVRMAAEKRANDLTSISPGHEAFAAAQLEITADAIRVATPRGGE